MFSVASVCPQGERGCHMTINHTLNLTVQPPTPPRHETPLYRPSPPWTWNPLDMGPHCTGLPPDMEPHCNPLTHQHHQS